MKIIKKMYPNKIKFHSNIFLMFIIVLWCSRGFRGTTIGPLYDVERHQFLGQLYIWSLQFFLCSTHEKHLEKRFTKGIIKSLRESLPLFQYLTKMENYNEQAYSCSRDWRLSGSWGPNLEPPWNPSIITTLCYRGV